LLIYYTAFCRINGRIKAKTIFLRGGKHIEKYWKWLIPILETAKNAEKSYIFVMPNLKKNTTLGKSNYV